MKKKTLERGKFAMKTSVECMRTFLDDCKETGSKETERISLCISFYLFFFFLIAK